jgi:hypothetical protein
MFSCVACGEPMVARLGLIVTHHFAHKSNNHCSKETYLHKLAKKVFQEEFEKCLLAGLPFEIELEERTICSRYPGNSECHFRNKELHVYDLTKHFSSPPKVEIEKGNLVPDITLESKSGKKDLWIEIAVTHECSAAKRDSRHRIIEIRVNSEEDLQPFRDHRLSVRDKRIKFFNFKPQIIRKEICTWFRCRVENLRFRIFKDDKWSIQFVNRSGPPAGNDEPNVVWFTDILSKKWWDERRITAECAYKAWQSNHFVRACLLCEHFDYWCSGECSKFHQRVEWSRAIECAHFSGRDWDELTNIFSELLS